jgi:hypothetical protein
MDFHWVLVWSQCEQTNPRPVAGPDIRGLLSRFIFAMKISRNTARKSLAAYA